MPFMVPKIVFLLALGFAASGWASPPMALAAGLAFGLLFANPFPERVRNVSRWLLQASVVGLGFGMNLHDVLRAGRSGFLYTFMGILFTMVVGLALGTLLAVKRKPAFLISTGTAICGGSAIAAVGPVAGASAEEMAVSLGTVFVLNSVALLTFPFIGAACKLDQSQFGLWAALAIHDTSSVVGAAAKYGVTALAVGTTVKLARALWIVPLTLGTAMVRHAKAKVQWPWFIALFVLAAVVNTYVAAGAGYYPWIAHTARLGMTVTLFLIGSGISIAMLRRVGYRPLLQGVLLWLIVSSTTLWLVRAGWIRL